MTRLRQTILRPVGLVTQPNKFGWYVDGALKRAINCVMRNPGELISSPGMYGSSNCGGVNGVVHKVMPLDAGHNYTFSVNASHVWDIRESNNGVNVPSAVSLTNLFSETGRISPVRSKERMLVNSANGVLVGDSMAPTTSTERDLRLAGLPQPTLITSGAIQPTTGGTIVEPVADTLVWGYQVIHTRTFSDGYEIVSVPTPVLKQKVNAGGGAHFNPFVDVSWASGAAVVGDVFELYRTDGLQVTDINSEPPSVFKLVASYTLAASDIAFGSVRINDYAKMGDAPYYQTTGRELYSNPGQGGATTVNRQPPIAQCQANFDGRTFYGNTTDRPRCSFQIPGGVGSSSDVARQTEFWRKNGIGTRFISGTVTSGSAVITGVSATDMQGIVPGQRWYSQTSTLWSYTTAFVVSVNPGAGTITMNAPASASAVGTLAFADCLYIGFNGGTKSPYRFADLGDLIINLGGAGLLSPASPANQFEITSNSAYYGGAVFQTIFAGAYNPNLSMTIEPKNFGSAFVTMQITATNGANYSPALAEYNTTATSFTRTQLKNHVAWSKEQQPEHVPPGSEDAVFDTNVGLREIVCMKSTSDALWFACLDGIFRLTGIGGQYRLDPVDSTKIICAPQAMDVLDEAVYIYTNYGLLEIDSESSNNVTDRVVGDLLPGPQYAEVATLQLVANEQDLEIVLLDSSSANRLYVYATRDGGGWTTLENNPGVLANITALAYQRSTSFGDPRILVGMSALGGTFPQLASWGNPASFLTMDVAFQPVYAGDPMSLKQWIEASFIFDTASAGKSLRPVWNSTPIGSANVVLYQNAAYARAGIPRQHAIAQSISAGCDSVSGATTQARLQGISLMFKPLTQQAKQRK